MTGPRYNEFIQSQKVRVIDENGENLGVMYTREAFEQAQGVGLDLVEISPNADPPVAKFLDIGRYKYEAQKKAAEQRKKQKTQEIKEIKMRPNIDDHDFDVKMRKVFEFLEEGDKVKVTLRFRGREMAHNQLGLAVLLRGDKAVGAGKRGGDVGPARQLAAVFPGKVEQHGEHLRGEFDRDLVDPVEHLAPRKVVEAFGGTLADVDRELIEMGRREHRRHRLALRGVARLVHRDKTLGAQVRRDVANGNAAQ